MHIDQRAQRTYIRNNETRSRGNNAASPVYSARSETAGGRGTREDAKKKRKENKKKKCSFPVVGASRLRINHATLSRCHTMTTPGPQS